MSQPASTSPARSRGWRSIRIAASHKNRNQESEAQSESATDLEAAGFDLERARPARRRRVDGRGRPLRAAADADLTREEVADIRADVEPDLRFIDLRGDASAERRGVERIRLGDLEIVDDVLLHFEERGTTED